MFWPFIEINGELTYCPLADFGTQSLREGRDIYGKAVVAQPLTGHLPLHNAAHANGKIVVVERGRCDFVTKVLHAQAAGAIAVLVANASRENPDEAFVMDAGRRSEEEVSSIRIPAMMISYNKAVTLFEQLRECFLDRRELSMTIKFLGAQTSAHVLEQIENAAKKREHDAQEISLQHKRAQQQREAADILRKRLGKSAEEEPAAVAIQVPTLSPSDASSPSGSASTSSASSKMSASTPTRTTSPRPRKRSISSEPPHELPLFLGDSMDTLSVASSVGSRSAVLFPAPSETIAMHPWCPMTTALLVVDVQNYFALEQNEASVPLLHAAGRAREFYKRVHSVVVPRLQDVLLACRACEGTEVLYTVVESATHDGRERSRAHKHAGLHVPRGGFGAQVLARVAPGDDDMVLPRTGANVFEATNVDYMLRNLGVSHLVIAGLSVLRAVPLCAQTALDRGYQVTLLRDALASSDGDEALDEALRRCERQGAQVLTAGAFVAELHSYGAESNNGM